MQLVNCFFSFDLFGIIRGSFINSTPLYTRSDSKHHHPLDSSAGDQNKPRKSASFGVHSVVAKKQKEHRTVVQYLNISVTQERPTTMMTDDDDDCENT